MKESLNIFPWILSWEVNGNEGKFTSVQPGDHIIATTIYKHGRVKKWKGIVLGDKKPKECKRHSCPKMPSFIPVSLDLVLIVYSKHKNDCSLEYP